MVYPDSKNQPAGGVRIKEVATYAHDGASPIINKYEYNALADQVKGTLKEGESSASLLRNPNYVYAFKSGIVYGNASIIYRGYQASTSTMAPLADYDGNNVVYGSVVESTPGYGKTVYTFHTEKPEEELPKSFPSPPVLPDFKRGKMISRRLISEDGQTVQLVENTYTSKQEAAKAS